MRTIRVTYRAVFEGPIKALNPMGLRIPGQFPVEVFGTGNKWNAREIATARRVIYERLPQCGSPSSTKTMVAEHFARQVQDWEIWGTIPPDPENNSGPEEKRLVPSIDICDLGNETWGLYGAEDRTHIAAEIKNAAKVKNALSQCGRMLPIKCFISTRANIEPTCPSCAEVYREIQAATASFKHHGKDCHCAECYQYRQETERR